jgi:hypothetical protein
MRRTDIDEDHIGSVLQAQQVPFELFMGTLRLFGDSIIAYHGEEGRTGPYRFYPAILMSAWASFEAFVRVYSELLVKTKPSLPQAVRCTLLEREQRLHRSGKIENRRKLSPLLDRFWWLLKFGHEVEYDRGSRIWQMGEAALRKRNILVHYEISDLPSVEATELWRLVEAILLLLIGPSAAIGVSIMPDQYELYGMLARLQEFVEQFEERPFFKDRQLRVESVMFPCPFRGVDEVRYPSANKYARGARNIIK